MNLRQKQSTNKPDAPEVGDGFGRSLDGDESLLRKDNDPPPPISPVSSRAPTSGSPPAPLILLRKISQSAITFINKDDNASGGTILDIFKDIFVGVVFGFITISFMIFLDHHNVIHLQSAHNFRTMAYNSLNDPETIASLEESSGLKFMTNENYNAMTAEVAQSQAKIDAANKKLEDHTQELELKEKELAPIKEEYEKLMADPSIRVDQYCEECKWKGKTSCAERVAYLMNTYHDSPVKAKIGAMNEPGCRKSE